MSEIVQQIADAIGVSPIPRGVYTRLIRVDDAQAFLSECARRGEVVLGIDVFDILPNGIRPDMALIADFSYVMELPEAERSSCSIAEATAFLNHVPRDNRALDFVIDSR